MMAYLEFGIVKDPGEAMVKAAKVVAKRYKGGKCTLCGGPSGPCAIRHATGRSCA